VPYGPESCRTFCKMLHPGTKEGCLPSFVQFRCEHNILLDAFQMVTQVWPMIPDDKIVIHMREPGCLIESHPLSILHEDVDRGRRWQAHNTHPQSLHRTVRSSWTTRRSGCAGRASTYFTLVTIFISPLMKTRHS
jgi:hypothetical protein